MAKTRLKPSDIRIVIEFRKPVAEDRKIGVMDRAFELLLSANMKAGGERR